MKHLTSEWGHNPTCNAVSHDIWSVCARMLLQYFQVGPICCEVMTVIENLGTYMVLISPGFWIGYNNERTFSLPLPSVLMKCTAKVFGNIMGKEAAGFWEKTFHSKWSGLVETGQSPKRELGCVCTTDNVMHRYDNQQAFSAFTHSQSPCARTHKLTFRFVWNWSVNTY